MKPWVTWLLFALLVAALLYFVIVPVAPVWKGKP